MYGWRARIGLIIPMDNAVIEPELYSLRELEGITFHTARLTTHNFPKMPDNGIELSETFNYLGTDVNVYACAETSFLKGVDGNKYITEQMQKITGKPALTALSSMIDAIKSLELKKVNLVTPYTDQRNKVLSEFFERMDIDVVNSISQTSPLYLGEEREPYKCNVEPPYTPYRMAKEIDQPDAEAVIISATNIRTFEIINILERDLQKPVITSNQAIVWSILRTLNIKQPVPSLGTLLNSTPYY